MKKLVLIFLFFNISVFAADYYLKPGVIKNNFGEAIPDAVVFSSSLPNYKIITDSLGKFLIYFENFDKDFVIIYHKDYFPKIIPASEPLNIVLQPVQINPRNQKELKVPEPDKIEAIIVDGSFCYKNLETNSFFCQIPKESTHVKIAIFPKSDHKLIVNDINLERYVDSDIINLPIISSHFIKIPLELIGQGYKTDEHNLAELVLDTEFNIYSVYKNIDRTLKKYEKKKELDIQLLSGEIKKFEQILEEQNIKDNTDPLQTEIISKLDSIKTIFRVKSGNRLFLETNFLHYQNFENKYLANFNFHQNLDKNLSAQLRFRATPAGDLIDYSGGITFQNIYIFKREIVFGLNYVLKHYHQTTLTNKNVHFSTFLDIKKGFLNHDRYKITLFSKDLSNTSKSNYPSFLELTPYFDKININSFLQAKFESKFIISEKMDNFSNSLILNFNFKLLKLFYGNDISLGFQRLMYGNPPIPVAEKGNLFWMGLSYSFNSFL